MLIRFFMMMAAIFAGLSVVLGAFGSHALKDKLSERYLEIFETGTRYEMYHSLALLLVALLLMVLGETQPFLVAAGFAFIAGIVIFSGSLYALSLSGISWLGAITPLGGLAFIIGWVCLAVEGWNFKGLS